MIIPETIKIGNSKYKVTKCNMVDFLNSLTCIFNKETTIGRICVSDDGRDREIRIKNMSPKQMERTFFHEVAHGIMWEMEKRYPKVEAWRNDEAFTDRLARILSKTFISLNNQNKKMEGGKR